MSAILLALTIQIGWTQESLRSYNSERTLSMDIIGSYLIIAHGDYAINNLPLSLDRTNIKSSNRKIQLNIGALSDSKFFRFELDDGESIISGYMRSEYSQSKKSTTYETKEEEDFYLRSFSFYDDYYRISNEEIGRIFLLNKKSQVWSPYFDNEDFKIAKNELNKIGSEILDKDILLFVHINKLNEYWIFKKIMN
jgi:hypothetical protein